MDRPIATAVRRRVLAKRIGAPILLVALGVGGFYAARSWISPSVDRSRIRVASVDAGPIESTISATGLVVPEFEQVLSSPITTRVLKILKRPGDTVQRGEAILELDVSESELALEKIDRQLALKQNQIAATRLTLEKTLGGLQSQVDIKALELASLEATTAQQRQLASRGVVSESVVRRAELDERTAKIQLDQLRKAMETERQSARTTVEGHTLELETLRSERVEAQRELDLATTRADRDGVLTWVVTDEGGAIQKGAIIARIADLNSFHVKATISDIHAGKLGDALPARIKINEQWTTGHVSAVHPTVENGTFTAEVTLDDPSSTALRSNLRVDVLLVTDRREHALRIAKGPFATASGNQSAFVIRGESAVRVPVRLGISDVEHYEVLEGLSDGDQVIVSDTSQFSFASEIRIR